MWRELDMSISRVIARSIGIDVNIANITEIHMGVNLAPKCRKILCDVSVTLVLPMS